MFATRKRNERETVAEKQLQEPSCACLSNANWEWVPISSRGVVCLKDEAFVQLRCPGQIVDSDSVEGMD